MQNPNFEKETESSEKPESSSEPKPLTEPIELLAGSTETSKTEPEIAVIEGKTNPFVSKITTAPPSNGLEDLSVVSVGEPITTLTEPAKPEVQPAGSAVDLLGDSLL